MIGVMNNTPVKYGAMSKYGADTPMTVVGIVMKVFQIDRGLPGLSDPHRWRM